MSVASALAWAVVLDDDRLEVIMLGLLEDTVWWLGLLGAVVAGALHALAPGHGKTLVGAYLAGTRGRPMDAGALGVLVAIMHTGSVLAVGLVFFATQRAPVGDRLEGWVRLLSAAAVVAVGVWLLRRALRARRSNHTHPLPATGHDDAVGAGEGRRLTTDVEARSDLDPVPGHEHRDHHHDLPDGVAPVSRAGIAAIASSGGLLPSPAAFLVLATAIAVGRTTYGLLLVAAFGIGLAACLTTIGLAVLWGRDRLVRHDRRRVTLLVGQLPLAAAIVVIGGGAWLAVLAVRAL